MHLEEFLKKLMRKTLLHSVFFFYCYFLFFYGFFFLKEYNEKALHNKLGPLPTLCFIARAAFFCGDILRSFNNFFASYFCFFYLINTKLRKSRHHLFAYCYCSKSILKRNFWKISVLRLCVCVLCGVTNDTARCTYFFLALAPLGNDSGCAYTHIAHTILVRIFLI